MLKQEEQKRLQNRTELEKFVDGDPTADLEVAAKQAADAGMLPGYSGIKGLTPKVDDPLVQFNRQLEVEYNNRFTRDINHTFWFIFC